MKCPGCNNENTSDAKVCIWCGKNVVVVEPRLPDKPAIGGWHIAGYLLAILIVLWLFDAPPIKNDYTVADLKSAAPQYNSSFEVLTSLAEEDEHRQGAPAIGLSAEDVNTVDAFGDVFRPGDIARTAEAARADAAKIELAWRNGARGRGVIDKLAEFAEIADLSEPTSFQKMDKDAMAKCWPSIKTLSYLYNAHICLEVEKGNGRVAAEELVKFDRVLRKLDVNARRLITKLVLMAVLERNMAMVDYIANRPQTSPETLAYLAQYFQGLDGSQTALRNAFIFEYLQFGKTLDWMHSKQLKWYPGLGNRRNSTCRYYRNLMDLWIAKSEGTSVAAASRLSVWPVIGPRWIDVDTAVDSKVNRTYMVYNPVGAMLVKILAPTLEKVLQLRTRLQMQGDMLQAVLNKRLGREVSLKARAYRDQYIIDIAGKRIVSPGPDGELNTRDDIKMPIDPNVVRFGKMAGE